MVSKSIHTASIENTLTVFINVFCRSSLSHVFTPLATNRKSPFVALPKLPSALETANLLVDHVFRLLGLPADIVSDRGPQFTSQVRRQFCKCLGTTVSVSSGFHPQSIGQTERLNQELEAALRCVVANNPTQWSTHLSWVEYAHNSVKFCNS